MSGSRLELEKICDEMDDNFDTEQLIILAKRSGIDEIDGVPVESATKKQLCAAISSDLEETRISRTLPRSDEEDFAEFEDYVDEEEGGEGDFEDADFEEDDTVFEEEELSKKESPSRIKGVGYRVVPREKILKSRARAIKRVRDVIGEAISDSKIILLLRYYKWDPAAVIDAWSDDVDLCCKNAGIPNPFCELEIPKKHSGSCSARAPTQSGARADDTSGQETNCSICFDDYKIVDFFKSGECDHNFCPDCWKSYIKQKVVEGEKKIMTCPSSKCNASLNEDTVRAILLETPELVTKYEQILSDSYIERNPLIKWCPGRDCTHAIEIIGEDSVLNEAVKCDCGTVWCFKCNKSEHFPSSCTMASEWARKNAGDEEHSLDLIAATTKTCPNCKNAVEKVSGCNRMTCKCGFMFCWNCNKKFGEGPMGSTDGYTTHQCNQSVYSTDTSVTHEGGEAQRRADEFKRFEWFSKRIMSHEDSYKLESTLRDYVVQHRNRLEDDFFIPGNGNHGIRLLYEAIDRVLLNRRLIVNSYVFGYFRERFSPDVNKNIFENIQNNLEMYTEQLSDLLPFTVKRMSDLKTLQAKAGNADDRFSHKSYYMNLTNSMLAAEKMYDALIDAAYNW